MRKCIVLLILMVSFCPAQDWQAIVTVDPFPTPFLSDWQIDPTLAVLEIHNNKQDPDVVIVSLEVFQNQVFALKAVSKRMLVYPGQPLMLYANEFSDWATESLNPSLERQAQYSGMIPEGDYEACIEIKNQWDQVLVQDICSFATIRHFEPPELVYPVDEQIFETQPLFQWIPPQFPAGKQFSYVFRLVERYPGQSPDRALAANLPHYENYHVFESDFQYPLEAQPLEPNRHYVWQIQAVDFQGRPVTKNDGKSILGLFSTGSDVSDVFSSVELVAPHDGAILETGLPHFGWQMSDFTSMDPVFFHLAIAELPGDMAPEQALSGPVQHFISSPLTESEMTYPSFAPALQTGKEYVWQVQAVDQSGSPMASNAGKSEIYRFSVQKAEQEMDRLLALLPAQLPLPVASQAYLLLRDGAELLVDYEISSDSTQMRIRNLDAEPATLVLPMMQTLHQGIPQVETTADLVVDLTTFEVISGTVVARLDPKDFDLSEMGIPVQIQRLTYQPGTGGLYSFTVDGMLTLLGQVQPWPVQLELTRDGRLTGTISRSGGTFVPLVDQSDRFQFVPDQINGSLNCPLLLRSPEFQFTVDGNLQWQTPQNVLPVSIAINESGISSVDPVGESGFSLSFPFADLQFSDITIEWFSYIDEMFDFGIYGSADFTFSELHGLSVSDVGPIQFTPQGFHFPQTSKSLAGSAALSYHAVSLTPLAFRMPSFDVDWFQSPAQGIFPGRFDMAVNFPNFPDYFPDALKNADLSLLDAALSEGFLVGDVYPRTFLQPARVAIDPVYYSGLEVEQLGGSFSDDPQALMEFFVKANVLMPDYGLAAGKVSLALDHPIALTPQGFFTGLVDDLSIPYPLKWGPLNLFVPQGQIRFGRSEGKQTLALAGNGEIEVPANLSGDSLKATGNMVFDLIASRLDSGSFGIDSRFVFSLPMEHPLLTFDIHSGARLDPKGFYVNDGANHLLLDAQTTVRAEFKDQVSFALPEMSQSTGTISIEDSLAFKLGLAGGKVYSWETVSRTTPLQDEDELLLILPSTTEIRQQNLFSHGIGRAEIRLNGMSYQGLNTRVSNDFSVSLDPVAIAQGKIDFYDQDRHVAVLDTDGFHPGDYFQNADLDKLPLPRNEIAFIDLRDEQGRLAVRVDTLSQGVHLTTPEGSTVSLNVPGLSGGMEPWPKIDIPLDVVIDPVTLGILSGKIEVQAGDDQALIDLTSNGRPLEVIRLVYRPSGHGRQLYVDVRPVLPQVLQSDAFIFAELPVQQDGIEGEIGIISPRFAYDPKIQSTEIGSQLSLDFTGARFSRDSLAVTLCGDVRAGLFTDPGGVLRPIHFMATLLPDDISFQFDLSHINGILPIDAARFQPVEMDDPALQLDMPFDRQETVLIANGIYSLPGVSEQFSLTLQDLNINANTVSAADMHLDSDQAQQFKLFGSTLTLTDYATDRVNKPAISFDYSDEKFKVTLAGTLHLFSNALPFYGLIIVSDGSLADGDLSTPGMSILAEMLDIQTCRIRSNALHISGNTRMPKPFPENNTSPFAFSVSPAGLIDAQQKEIPLFADNDQKPIVQLGLEPFKISCQPSAAILKLSDRGTALEASLDISLLTRWPGVPDSLDIPINAIVESDDSSDELNWQMQTDYQTYETSFAGFVKMTIERVGILADEEFKIRFSGSFIPDMDSIEGDGISFEAFTIWRNGFDIGVIGDGYFNAQGFEVFVTETFFDLDPAPFEMYMSDEGDYGPAGVEVYQGSVDINNFCLKFGGRIKYYKAFDGGVDEVLIYKGTDEFHLIVRNAEFRLQNDLFWGALDLRFHLFSIARGEYQVLAAGNLIFTSGSQTYRFVAAGEVAWKDDDISMGLFLAAGGLHIQLSPFPIYIEDVGGGIFINPDPEVEDLVVQHCRLEHTTPVNDAFDYYKNHDDLFALFLYGGMSIGDNSILKGRALWTITNSHIRFDNELKFLDNPAYEKAGVTITGRGHFEIGFYGSYYAEGNMHVYTTSNKTFAKQSLITLDGLAEFWVYDSDTWGLRGELNAAVINMFDQTMECWVVPSGLLVRGESSRGWGNPLFSIDAGIDLGVWFTWRDPKQVGGYLSTFLEASILEGLATARGELGAAMMYDQMFYFYGYAELTASVFSGDAWTGLAWVKWQDGEFSAGLGGDNEIDQFLASAEQTFEEMLQQTEDLTDEMNDIMLDGDDLANTLLSEEEIQAIVQQLTSDQNKCDELSDMISTEIGQLKTPSLMKYMSASAKDLNRLASYSRGLLAEPDLSSYQSVPYTEPAVILDPLLYRQEMDDSTNYFRRVPPDSMERRPINPNVRTEITRNESDALVRNFYQTNSGRNSNNDRLQRYQPLDSQGRLTIEQQIEQILSENRAASLDLLNELSFSLDSLHDASVEMLENPLTVSKGAENKRLDFYVDPEKINSNQRKIGRLQSQLARLDNKVFQTLRAIDSDRSKIYSSLGPRGAAARLGRSFMNASTLASSAPYLMTEGVEKEYHWYTRRLADFTAIDPEGIVDGSYHSVSQDKRFLQVLDPDGVNPTAYAVTLKWVDQRITFLREISGLNLWPDWETVYEDYSGELSQTLSSFFENTGTYLVYTIPAEYAKAKRERLAASHAQLIANSPGVEQSVADAHTRFTSSLNPLWEKYALISENLYDLYDSYLQSEYIENRPVRKGKVETRLSQLEKEFEPVQFSKLAAKVNTEPWRSASEVTINWAADVPARVGEFAYQMREGLHSDPTETGYRSVGNARELVHYFLPESLPPQQNINITLSARVRNRVGYTNTNVIRFQPVLQGSEHVDVQAFRQYLPDFDLTPPRKPNVVFPSMVYQAKDAQGNDFAVVFEDRVRVRWNSFDRETGIGEYMIAVGTAPGLADIRDWTSKGTNKQAEIKNLAALIQQGNPVYINVKAINLVNMPSETGTSIPLYVNIAPPVFADIPLLVDWENQSERIITGSRGPCYSRSPDYERTPRNLETQAKIYCPYAFTYFRKNDDHDPRFGNKVNRYQYRIAFSRSDAELENGEWKTIDPLAFSKDRFIFLASWVFQDAPELYVCIRGHDEQSDKVTQPLIYRIENELDDIRPSQIEFCVEPRILDNGQHIARFWIERFPVDLESGIAGLQVGWGRTEGEIRYAGMNSGSGPLGSLDFTAQELHPNSFSTQFLQARVPAWLSADQIYCSMRAVDRQGNVSAWYTCGPVCVQRPRPEILTAVMTVIRDNSQGFVFNVNREVHHLELSGTISSQSYHILHSIEYCVGTAQIKDNYIDWTTIPVTGPEVSASFTFDQLLDRNLIYIRTRTRNVAGNYSREMIVPVRIPRP
ncbi:hypothetical protein GF406_08650 [candidate division KSB1 bacterium]|nr:hypothetical protein [candidate division KSB1 bacterium]